MPCSFFHIALSQNTTPPEFSGGIFFPEVLYWFMPALFYSIINMFYTSFFYTSSSMLYTHG